MKEHNYALQNADTRPSLQSRTQNICFVISISAVNLKLMVKITSILAWHFLTSHHFLASWNWISSVLRSRRANAHLLVKFNAWTSQRLFNWNSIPKLTIVLIWKTPACLKFGKNSNCGVENLPQGNSESGKQRCTLSTTEFGYYFM